jgi:putative ATP-dependent endonuclease of OLD family
MYLSEITIENFRLFGKPDPAFTLRLSPGVTALVGENDAGKTCVVDAIRYALLTRDLDYIRVQRDDFHLDADGTAAAEIVIRCKLSGLDESEKGAFAEYLTYEEKDAALYVHWSARNLTGSMATRRVADVSVRSGNKGDGPTLDPQVRQLLAAAYLKPLRDAEREMAPGVGSRLSQVLANLPGIEVGEQFDADAVLSSEQASNLSLAGMAEYFRHLVDGHGGLIGAAATINSHYLSQLALADEKLHGRLAYARSGSDAARLRQILERLQLDLLEGPDGTPRGRYGLGSNNLLYMACELLLLGRESEGLPLLLIEEPEAHLQPQRQLRLMEFLETAAKQIPGSRPVQAIVTTHSPNLASKIPLKNVVLIEGERAYSMAPDETKLDKGDYRFLERFLDSTKANLFFAGGVIIVEGDAEAILIPAIARLIDRDLTSYGVSIVNVGGTGLRRYARIFQQAGKDGKDAPQPSIPVACLADMDVMPDCAPEILSYVTGDDDPQWGNPRRRWHARRDLGKDEPSRVRGLEERRKKLRGGDGGRVKTFVADHWTLEYDLARAGLAKHVYIAALLADNDDYLNDNRKERDKVIADATSGFEALDSLLGADPEVLCSKIYRLFAVDRVSKAVAAQHLVEVLEAEVAKDGSFKETLRSRLPEYIVAAIDYATRAPVAASAGGSD